MTAIYLRFEIRILTPMPLSRYGQLGHGTSGEYIAKQGKTDYEFVLKPQVIAGFGGPTAGATAAAAPPVANAGRAAGIACGNHHTVLRTDTGLVFTWGFGGYGRCDVRCALFGGRFD
jgi:alpha-tubulin suppressor-like RCC1 family protein